MKKITSWLFSLSVLWAIALPVLAVQINNPIQVNSAAELAGLIIKTLLGLVGIIALIYFILGGFMWMTAAGNQEKIKKGRDTLVWATIGLVIIFASYSIVYFVLGIFD